MFQLFYLSSMFSTCQFQFSQLSSSLVSPMFSTLKFSWPLNPPISQTPPFFHFQCSQLLQTHRLSNSLNSPMFSTSQLSNCLKSPILWTLTFSQLQYSRRLNSPTLSHFQFSQLGRGFIVLSAFRRLFENKVVLLFLLVFQRRLHIRFFLGLVGAMTSITSILVVVASCYSDGMCR